MNRGWRTTSAPVPSALRTTLPARVYADPAWFATEMDRIFAGMWVAAGRVDRLDRPGAFVRRDVAGASVLLVRAPDGAIRGLSQRLPASRHALCARGTGTLPRQHPVSVSRVDLRTRRPAARRAADGRGRRVRSSRYRSAPSPATWDGHLFINLVGRSRRRCRAARRPAGALCALAHAGPAARCAASTTTCAPTGSWWCRTTTSACTAR